MKLSALLLSTAILTCAGSAMAVEITHPFYGPSQNRFLSTTTYSFDNYSTKEAGQKGNWWDHNLNEEFAYGITDAVTVYAGGGNWWEKAKEQGGQAETGDRNLYWNVGTSYTYACPQDKFFARARVDYMQRENGKLTYNESGDYKALSFLGKVGYDTGFFVPYIQVAAEVPVFQSREDVNAPFYVANIGAYKLFGNVSTDLSAGFYFDDEADNKDYHVKADVGYIFAKNISAGISAAYDFHGRGAEDYKYHGYILGANLKVAF